jgi:hypothetical protein
MTSKIVFNQAKRADFERFWVENLKNPPETIRFVIKNGQRAKFLCLVCDDGMERFGDRRNFIEHHSDSGVHQDNLKRKQGGKEPIDISSSSSSSSSDDDDDDDDDAKKSSKSPTTTKKKETRSGRRRRRSRRSKDKGKEEEKDDAGDHPSEEEEEQEQDGDSDSDRPSKKRDLFRKKVDLTYTHSSGTRVSHAVASLPKPQRARKSSVVAVVPAQPAAQQTFSAHAMFQQRLAETFETIMMSDMAKAMFMAQFEAFMTSEEGRAMVREACADMIGPLLTEFLTAFFASCPDIKAFMASPEAPAMMKEAFQRFLDGPIVAKEMLFSVKKFINE